MFTSFRLTAVHIWYEYLEAPRKAKTMHYIWYHQP